MKNRIFSGLGSSLEWFDFALYGFLGPIFSVIFFPHAKQSGWFSLLMTYAIFAIGFAARPMGGLLFGYLGDKYGRLVPLRITPLLITFTSLMIAILPTYESVGYIAPVLLLVTRIIQGILLGGEFAGNIVYLCESSSSWKYFWGSIGSCTGSFGIMLASIVSSLSYHFFSQEFMYSYGWRLTFLIALPLGAITFYMRLKMSESKEFRHIDTHINPIISALKNHKKRFLSCLGLIYLHATSYYFIFMFIPLYLSKVKGIPQSAVLVKNSGFLLFHLLVIPLLGAVVNIIGGLRASIVASCIFLFLSIPAFYYISHGVNYEMLCSLLLLSIASSLNAAIIPGLLVEIVPVEVRYTLIGLAFNIGFGIFGGTMPVIGLLLIKNTGVILSPAIYLTLVSAVTLAVGYNLLKVNRNHEVREV